MAEFLEDGPAPSAGAALSEAAARRTPNEVEAALGRFRRGRAVEAARTAAGVALAAGRWDNLAYLADFLHDVTVPHPPTGGGDDPSSCDRAGILAYVVPARGHVAASEAARSSVL